MSNGLTADCSPHYLELGGGCYNYFWPPWVLVCWRGFLFTTKDTAVTEKRFIIAEGIRLAAFVWVATFVGLTGYLTAEVAESTEGWFVGASTFPEVD